ncbi:hypothetical protein FAVG1_03295 [Fusarium avenaceum]|nr:hypothetical protein FAVG1_03295 [Fusarium avenaceum]
MFKSPRSPSILHVQVTKIDLRLFYTLKISVYTFKSPRSTRSSHQDRSLSILQVQVTKISVYTFQSPGSSPSILYIQATEISIYPTRGRSPSTLSNHQVRSPSILHAFNSGGGAGEGCVRGFNGRCNFKEALNKKKDEEENKDEEKERDEKKDQEKENEQDDEEIKEAAPPPQQQQQPQIAVLLATLPKPRYPQQKP